MKHLILALITISAFSLSSSASTAKDFAKQKSVVMKNNPPRNGFRVGTYHRNVPRHANRVVRNGNVYFNYNGVFFSPRGRGWVVVTPPQVYRPRYTRNVPRYNNRAPRYNNRSSCRVPQNRGNRNGQIGQRGQGNGPRGGRR